MEDIVCNEFISQAIHRIHKNTEKLAACMKQLDEKEVWVSPNENMKSIGNLILHLCGNIRQYIISSLGRSEDVRERNLEFSTNGGYSKKDLMTMLETTVGKSVDIIRHMSPEELMQNRMVQGMAYTGIGIVVHVSEHYSCHSGQIILMTKLLKNIDLGFYAGIDLNKKNEF
jgi:uncharacterized damage-inducible protein DinB